MEHYGCRSTGRLHQMFSGKLQSIAFCWKQIGHRPTASLPNCCSKTLGPCSKSILQKFMVVKLTDEFFP
jgi:hypothetical protein